MNAKKCLQLMIGVLILCCFAMEGLAGDEKSFGNRMPTEDELINALAPDPAPLPEGYKRRALRPTRTERPAPRAAVRLTPAPAKAASMEIRFAKNSYELTGQATQTLDVVGRALSSGRLRDCQFTIEGHTDASGDDWYNLRLSKKRAAEVKRYLVAHFNVDPNSLRTVGKGESEPLLKNNPYASRNRRVKIISTGR